MTDGHAASPRQGSSYAEQYLGRSADTSSPEQAPYGPWYAERLRRTRQPQGLEADTAAAGALESQGAPHRAEPLWATHDAAAAPRGPRPFESQAAAEAAAPAGAQPGGAAAGPPPPPPGDTGPAPAEAAPQPPQPGPAPEPCAPPAELSGRVQQQLEQNRRELSLIEGNLVASAQERVSTVYVTSCFRGEGKTTAALSTAYGLAVFSQARVLLVDGANVNARLHGLLNVAPYPGLNDLVDGRIALPDALHPTRGLPGLHFLAAGGGNGTPSETRRIDQVSAFLRQVRPHYDFVVVDGTSALASSDPARLAPCFDGVVFVVACERTKWEVVQGAVDKVRGGGGRVLGGVLNRRRYYIPQVVYQWISR